jgi:hypothetical protein
VNVQVRECRTGQGTDGISGSSPGTFGFLSLLVISQKQEDDRKQGYDLKSWLRSLSPCSFCGDGKTQIPKTEVAPEETAGWERARESQSLSFHRLSESGVLRGWRMHEVREAEGDRVTDQFTAYTHTVLGGEKLAEHKLNTQPQNHKCKPVSRYPPVSSVFSIRIRRREKPAP